MGVSLILPAIQGMRPGTEKALLAPPTSFSELVAKGPEHVCRKPGKLPPLLLLGEVITRKAEGIKGSLKIKRKRVDLLRHLYAVEATPEPPEARLAPAV